MLEYSPYNELVETIERVNTEDTYQELMNKEEKVLDTINSVIKHYKDIDIKEKEFINLPLSLIVFKFFNTWINMFNDVIEGDVKDFFNKEDRLLYIGVTLILLSITIYIFFT